MKIEREKGLDSLSEPLRQMAEIRMENPDLSLNELAKMFEPPISRSGVNHRLSRLDIFEKAPPPIVFTL